MEMKKIIIHPEDSSTDFLCGIYATLDNKDVIRGGIDKYELLQKVAEYDQIMMMGHGTPFGLLSMSKFIEPEMYIIDEVFVNTIKKKNNSLYI